MKNEKMKRVAALALAGTIAVSTVSPAAFADAEGSGTEPETLSTSQDDSSATTDTTSSTTDNGGTPDGSGSSGTSGSTPDDDTGNTDTIPVSEPAAVEEAVTATPSEEFKDESTTPVVVEPVIPDGVEGELTVKPDDDGDGVPEVVVGDDEIPVDNEGVLGVTEEDNKEDPDKTDITIGDYPDTEGTDGNGKPGTLTPKPVETTPTTNPDDPKEEPKFEDEKDEETASDIESAVEDTIQNQVDNNQGGTLGDEGNNTVNVTHKDPNDPDKEETYTYGVTQVGDKTTSTDGTTTYTLNVSCGALDVKEDKPLTAEEMAEILGVGLKGKPVYENGKLVSFTDENDNTYTVSQNKGNDGEDNQTTNISWTIRVTETTHQESKDVTDKIEVEQGSLEKVETTTPPAPQNQQDQQQNTAEEELGLKETDIQDILNGEKEQLTIGDVTYTVTKDETTGGYTLKNDDSSISYTITTTVGQNIKLDENMSLEKIAELMGGATAGYTVVKDDGGNALYIQNEDGHRLTIATGQEIGQTLLVEIKKTNTQGAQSDIKTDYDKDNDGEEETLTGEQITGQDGLDAALKAEQQQAALEALKAQLGTELEPGATETITWTQNGTEWTATINGKTYTVHVASDSGSTLESVKDDVTAGEDGKKDVTVTGNAWVQSGTITWTGKYDGAIVGQDFAGENQTCFNDSGNLCFGNKVALPEKDEVYTTENKPTFNGEAVNSVIYGTDENSNKTCTITTTVEGKTKTYTFTYESVNAAGTVTNVTGDANGTGTVTVSDDTTQGGGLTKLTWTVATVEDLASTWTDKQLSTGASITKVEGDNNEYLYKENATDTGTTLYYNESDGKYYTNYTNGNFTGTAYSKELDIQNPLTVDEVKAMLTEKGVTIPEDATINLDTTNHTVTYTDTDGKTVTMSYQDEQKYTIVKEEEVSISATGTDDQSDVTKETAIQSVVSQLESVYTQGSNVQIKEYEEYLKGDKFKEFQEKYETENGYALDLNTTEGKTAAYNAFADYILKEQVTGTQLEGDALGDYLKQNISTENGAGNPINNKTTNTHSGNHFDLGVNSTLVLENGNTADCVLMRDGLTVKSGTLNNLVNNFDSEENYQFGLQNSIQKQSGQDHFEYTRTEGNEDHTFTDANKVGKDKSNSYYRITGTIAYVSEKNKDNELFTTTYSKEDDVERAKRQAIDQGCDPTKLNVVTYKEAHTNALGFTYYTTSYKLYDSTAELDTYGYLTDDTNGCIGSNKDLLGRPTPEVDGYDLLMDELVMNGGKVVAGYKGQTSWSATLHKITPESGSSLTVNSLLKTDQATTGNRTSGTYIATQALKVTEDKSTGGAVTLLLDGVNNDAQASKDTAAFSSGPKTDKYTLYKTWETTTETYNANANQYGKVTVTGTDGQKEEKDAVIQSTYTTVKAEAVKKTETTTREVYAELTKAPAPTQPGTGGGDEDTELPPEEDPSDDLVLILTDVPTEEEIADEATALAAGPETEETVIEEEETPLVGAPVEEAEIEEEETPLSAVPKTGDESGVFGLMAVLSGMALAVLSFIDRKGRHARFGSQH